MKTSAFLKSLHTPYSLEEAIQLGLLIDVTTDAKRLLNYPVPVAISGQVYDLCVKWDRFDSDCQVYQRQTLRLHSLLIVAKTAAKIRGEQLKETDFVYAFIPRDGYSVAKVAKSFVIKIKQSEHGNSLIIEFQHDLYAYLSQEKPSPLFQLTKGGV